MAAPLPQPQTAYNDEEKLAAFDAHPLFMKSLPADDNLDPAVQALQNLAYDGTPDEVASNFKDQGNEHFRDKRYRDAASVYTQGIDVKPGPEILEPLLCNRAACNLELKNYGSVLKDCSKALTINPKSQKALYRSGCALVALERYDEAIDCCDVCVRHFPDNSSAKALREKAILSRDAKSKKEQEKAAKELKERQERRQLSMGLRARNIITVPDSETSEPNPYVPHIDPDSDPTNPELVFPVFFLYPQHATSDMISHFYESTPFAMHIQAMFPPEGSRPEWDTNNEYNAGSLVVYAITHKMRILKVGKKMTLRDVFKAAAGKDGVTDGLVLKNNCLSFAILPSGKVEKEWVQEYKNSVAQ
ncbi:TPR-like protein [Sistotremastrum niveocremeum HHB9708]|uniref:TPR-like protein n=1 Tax=Sistotremastrum niveocremeum HHB9708 TaxID=1314777 RepID=A0A164Z6L7_9AGAM|nr:TPR-like protein [Sistotremastrum niveocremeum HHB9708]